MPVTKQVTLNFEDFLPPAPVGDPFQAQFRVKLIELLRSQGEILPSAESTLGRLWRLVNSDSSSIEDCVRVIEIDPAMTTRVFRVANSASCGGRATNISEAVLHLGFARLRELVFNAGIFAQFSQLHLPPGWNHFWIRNILIARLTERLASAYFQTNGTEYLAGLLHDIGWLNLATFFPEEFNMILSNPLPINEAEKQVLPCTHADISAAICARSLLPARVVNAVIYHHDPMLIKAEKLNSPAESARFLSVILNICDKLADCCQMQVFENKPLNTSEVERSIEALWLNNFGPTVRFDGLIAEELPRAQEVFSIFFPTATAGAH